MERQKEELGLEQSGEGRGSDPALAISPFHSGGWLPAQGWWQPRQRRVGRSKDERSQAAWEERCSG